MDFGLRENSSFIWVCLEIGNTHTTKKNFSTWRKDDKSAIFLGQETPGPKGALGHLNFKEQDPSVTHEGTGRQEK